MIYGKRIRFRGIERTDLPTFVDWLNDPEVRQGLSHFLPMSMAREELWFEDLLKLSPEQQGFAMEAKLDDTWTLIGSIGFHEIDWISRKAEIGIMIGVKSQWNQGYGSEAMSLMLQHGFETLNLHRIYLKVFSNNPRAIRSYEKAGFVHESRLREAHFVNGAYVDDLIMSVLRPEWQSVIKDSPSKSGGK
jgi:RimJ/RimL family protein N-acetyltransferase